MTTHRSPGPAAPDLPARRPAAVQVTVVDGDTNVRVRGARVTIGRRAGRSNAKGIARVKLAHRGALVTVAAKPGYTARTVRLSFRTHPKSTIRIYRRSLQWAMYGADPARSQAQADLRVRPPFRVIWSRGLGTLIEFPAVVQDGVAYIANAKGTVRALDMRNGRVIWRHDTPHGKMAASPAVWGDQVIVHGMDGHVWVLRRSEVASAIVGASRPEQVEQNVAASGVTLSDDTLRAIDEALGHVPVTGQTLAPGATEGVKHR